MDKVKKLELIKRSLGIRHKLKVHESMKQPETHEDLAVMLLARWELEDELKAIEEILADTRQENADAKKRILIRQDSHEVAEQKIPAEPGTKKAKKKY